MSSDFAYFIVALMFVATHVFTVQFFLKRISKINTRIAKLSSEVSLLTLRSPGNVNKKTFDPKMMEGDLDLVFKGKSASVRAIFYPRKIR